MNIKAELRKAGELARRLHSLPHLALEVARAAKRGDVDIEDAAPLYLEYYKVASGLREADIITTQSFKTNTSKLRKIIQCSDPVLLEKVMKLHEQRRGQRHRRSCYDTMVDVCRFLIAEKRRPTDEELEVLATIVSERVVRQVKPSKAKRP